MPRRHARDRLALAAALERQVICVAVVWMLNFIGANASTIVFQQPIAFVTKLLVFI